MYIFLLFTAELESLQMNRHCIFHFCYLQCDNDWKTPNKRFVTAHNSFHFLQSMVALDKIKFCGSVTKGESYECKWDIRLPLTSYKLSKDCQNL